MTKAEWLCCDDPQRLLAYLGRSKRWRLSERKLRLFACACCRRIWHLLDDERNRKAIEVAEEFADKHASMKTLRLSFTASLSADLAVPCDESQSSWYASHVIAADAACLCAQKDVSQHVRDISNLVVQAVGFDHSDIAWARTKQAGAASTVSAFDLIAAVETNERVTQAAFIRDLSGNLSRSATLPRGWLTWNAGTIPKIAQGIYDHRRFTELPILADALEEAGCTDDAILEHCRSGGEHVRGCWVVDLLLGKE